MDKVRTAVGTFVARWVVGVQAWCQSCGWRRSRHIRALALNRYAGISATGDLGRVRRFRIQEPRLQGRGPDGIKAGSFIHEDQGVLSGPAPEQPAESPPAHFRAARAFKAANPASTLRGW